MESPKYSSLFLLAIVVAPSLAGAVWDLDTDFRSDQGNPHGAWSYGYKHHVLGSLTVFPDSGSDAAWDWWHDNANLTLGAPAVSRNKSMSTINGIEPNEVSLHPGPATEITYVRWVAPGAGTYHVSGQFDAGDGGAVDLYIYHNGDARLTELGTLADRAFDFEVIANSGDSLDFMVGKAGSFFYDSTPLHATVVLVPEPATLLALGIVSLMLLRRR